MSRPSSAPEWMSSLRSPRGSRCFVRDYQQRVEASAIVGFLLVGIGVATFMPKLYDDAARLPGRRGGAMGAMTGGMRIAYLVTPVAVGSLAGTTLSVGDAIAIFALPATIGLAIVTEANNRLLRRTFTAP